MSDVINNSHQYMDKAVCPALKDLIKVEKVEIISILAQHGMEKITIYFSQQDFVFIEDDLAKKIADKLKSFSDLEFKAISFDEIEHNFAFNYFQSPSQGWTDLSQAGEEDDEKLKFMH